MFSKPLRSAMVLFPGVISAAVTPEWKSGKDSTDNYFKKCYAYLQFWSYSICVLDKDWEKNLTKLNHLANVYMQIVDNDENGTPDDE